MMRFSARQQVLRDLRKVLETRESAAITRALLSDEDSDEYALDEYWSNRYTGETRVGGSITVTIRMAQSS